MKGQALNLGIFVNYPIPGIVNRKAQPVYNTWRSMLARCYNPNHNSFTRYGGSGVKVCDAWHDFQTFARWYEDNYVDGWHMDKDLLSPQAKIYSPDTCVYLPHDIHHCIGVKHKKGVYKVSKAKGYGVKMYIDNKRTYLGYYNTAEEAEGVYKQAVQGKIQEYLDRYPHLPPKAIEAIRLQFQLPR